MKKYIILAVFLSILLLGCINPFGKKEYVCDDGKFVPDPLFCRDKQNVTSISDLTLEIGVGLNNSLDDLQSINDEWN